MELRLEIDPLRLDDEWTTQPKQRQVFGELLADAQAELDTAKSRLELAKAEADREIRESPEDYGVAKITENAVSTAVTLHPAVQVAIKRLNTTRHAANVLQAAVDGLEHRKRALTCMVELHGQDYFATPKMPAGVKNKKRRHNDEDRDDDD